jgi:hypothetical protein
MIVVALCAVTAFAVLGCVAAGYAITKHQPPATVVTRTVTSPPKIKVVTRWRTRTRRVVRTVTEPGSGATVLCFAEGLGEVYPAGIGGAVGGMPEVQCTVSFREGQPASSGGLMRLTTVPTSRYPQPVSDSYSFANTGNG